MSDLNKLIRSAEHKVAVEVLSIIVSKANEYTDTIAKDQNEKSLVLKIKNGEKVNEADVKKLLPVSCGFNNTPGNLDLLEVLFLQSIFSENKINADNVKTIADVIKGTSDTKKSIEKYLLEYFLAPLESVWAADQYQNDKFNGLSDATKKVFEIIYKDFLSSQDAITAIDFSSANFQAKDMKLDAFNLIITRCLELGVDDKIIKKLIDKGIDLIASSKTLLTDLYIHIKFAFYQKVSASFANLDKSAKDDAANTNKELLEVIKLVETKVENIGLKIDDSIEEYINLANKVLKAFGNVESCIPHSKAGTEAEHKANKISEKFINGVIDEIEKYKGQSDDLTFDDVQVKNILKNLSGGLLDKEYAKTNIKNLMKYKSGSLEAEAFKPIGEYQNSVKDALYTCANYLKNGTHLNNCFARLNDQKLIDGVKQGAKSDVCYFKQSESGNGQYSNLHITFAGEGHPNYRVEKTANPTGGCIEIKDNDPLELLAIATELNMAFG